MTPLGLVAREVMSTFAPKIPSSGVQRIGQRVRSMLPVGGPLATTAPWERAIVVRVDARSSESGPLEADAGLVTAESPLSA